jgi:NAD-dependent deacetylase
MDQYQAAAELIVKTKNLVAFTGAGISVDSGIPAFRGGQGLWDRYNPMEYAEISAFERHPEKVWIMLREMSDVILQAKPSAAHRALGILEKKGILRSVITQNVDGLHQEAGNSDVIEYHGNHRVLKCTRCSRTMSLEREAVHVLPFPVCPMCRQPLKPDVVFFGEQIPMQAMVRANQEVQNCHVMLVIGTSATVYPAADIPYMAKSHGAAIIEVNVEPTSFTSSIANYFLQGKASDVMPVLMNQMGFDMY